VPHRDSKSLAQALIRLLNDDQLRRAMGKNALLKVNGVLSWESVAEKTLSVYEEALHKKVRPRNDRKN
jgi:glycosyltransferase involved in cell wall biosynthesis